jgi:hypothetical protein
MQIHPRDPTRNRHFVIKMNLLGSFLDQYIPSSPGYQSPHFKDVVKLANVTPATPDANNEELLTQVGLYLKTALKKIDEMDLATLCQLRSTKERYNRSL